MRIAVIGGSGRAGARIVAELTAAGHQTVAVSPSTGVDTLTGAGLAAALESAAVVIDVSNAPSGDPLAFFNRSTRNVLEHEARLGVRHHLMLSIVGADRMPDAPYMRAKAAQEEIVRNAGIDHTIVRATQFHEYIPTLADAFTVGHEVRVPAARMQPVALADVVELVCALATGNPSNGTV